MGGVVVNSEDRSPQEEADARFLDALLSRSHRPDPRAHERRVEAALTRMRAAGASEAPGPTSPSRLRRFLVVAVPVAAAVLVVVLLGVGGADRAVAVINRSIGAMEEGVDRQYALEIVLRRARPLTGELFLRGTGERAVRLHRSVGDLWAGEGPEGKWLVPARPQFPVITGVRGPLIRLLLPEPDLQAPVLRIGTILRRLRDDYTVEADDRGAGWMRLDGRLNDRDAHPQHPTRVLLVADSEGTVRELRLDWDASQMTLPRRITLSLTGSERLSDNFYSHQAHHDGRRTIERR